MRRALSALPIAGADALAERAGGDVDERQPRRRVPSRSDRSAQLQQLGAIERAGLGPRRVQNRRRVPFDSTNRSLAGFCGFADRNASRRRKSAAITSAIEQQLVGWPLPASDVDVSESMRSRVAMFVRAGMSVARSRAWPRSLSVHTSLERQEP
jgi:hypothetical protein